MPNLSEWTRADLMAFASLLVSAMALLVSALAAIGTVHQARTTAQAHRRSIEEDHPIVEYFPPEVVDAWPGSIKINCTLKNMSRRSIFLEKVSINRCGRAIILPYGVECRPTGPNGPMKLIDKPPSGTMKIIFNRRLAPSGKVEYAFTDEINLNFYVVPRRGILHALLRHAFGRKKIALSFSVVIDMTKKTTKEIVATIPLPTGVRARAASG